MEFSPAPETLGSILGFLQKNFSNSSSTLASESGPTPASNIRFILFSFRCLHFLLSLTPKPNTKRWKGLTVY